MKIKDVVKTLLKDGFILVFNMDKLDVVKTAQALIDAGIYNMEITCRITDPLKKIERLRKELPEFMAGAASLVDNPRMLEIYNKANSQDPLPTVQQAVDAGSNYLVSAMNFSSQTYEKFAGKLPIIPGCGTVTEVVSQYAQGANFIKVFPAKELGGPAFVKAFDPAIHKVISIVPTGGTNMGNIPDYINAGILVLGGSFSIIEKNKLAKIVDQQDYKLLTDELKIVKTEIDRLRSEKYPNLDINSASLEQFSSETGRIFNV